MLRLALGFMIVIYAAALSSCCRCGAHVCCTGVNFGLGSDDPPAAPPTTPLPPTSEPRPEREGDIINAIGFGHDERTASNNALDDALSKRDRTGFGNARMRIIEERFVDTTPHVSPKRIQCTARYRILEAIPGSATTAAPRY